MSVCKKGNHAFLKHVLLLVCAGMFFAIPAHAELLYLPFDGDASPGRIYQGDRCTPVDGGEAATPCVKYVAGKFGRALEVGNAAVVAVPLDLDPHKIPRITVTAWIRLPRSYGSFSGIIFSDGPDGLPVLQTSGGSVLMRGGRSKTRHPDRLGKLPLEEWVLVAGVWDYRARTMRVHEGNVYQTFTDLNMDLDPKRRHVRADTRTWKGPGGATGKYVFVGSMDFLSFALPAKRMQIDDVRVFPRALSVKEIAEIARGHTSGSGTTRRSAPVRKGSGDDTVAHGPSVETVPGSGGDGRNSSGLPTGKRQTPGVGIDGQAGDRSVVQQAESVEPAGKKLPVVVPKGSVGDQVKPQPEVAQVRPGGRFRPGQRCSSDDSCADGGTCYSVGGAPSVCYQRCDFASDCPAGNQCQVITLPDGTQDRICTSGQGDLPEPGRSGTPPVVLQKGSVGDQVKSQPEVAQVRPGGRFRPGQRCSSDDSCADGGTCYSVGGAPSVCYQRCDFASDCPSGRDCQRVTLPGGVQDGICSLAPGEVEKSSSPGDGFVPGQRCDSDESCAGGACYSVGGAPSVCYQRCDTATDCPAGNRCQVITLPDGTQDRICTSGQGDLSEPGRSGTPPVVLPKGSVGDQVKPQPEVAQVRPGGRFRPGQRCSSDDSCADGGTCYSVGGAPSVCYQRCDFASDCPAGNQCRVITLPDGTQDRICTSGQAGGKLPVDDRNSIRINP